MAEKSQTKAAAAMADDKKRAIETAMQQIERTYGKGSIMRFGDNTVSNVEAISTGSLALDLALGIGGLPKGRIIEIYGPESSGKTTLALHVLAQAQKAGGEVAFIDAEHALDITYARALGVKVEDMLVSQPDTGEQALEITEALVRSGAIDVIVVDSVAALVPRAEIEGEMGDSFVGLHARLMSQALRKLTGAVGKTNTIVIFINIFAAAGIENDFAPSSLLLGVDFAQLEQLQQRQKQRHDFFLRRRSAERFFKAQAAAAGHALEQRQHAFLHIVLVAVNVARRVVVRLR